MKIKIGNSVFQCYTSGCCQLRNTNQLKSFFQQLWNHFNSSLHRPVMDVMKQNDITVFCLFQ